MPKPDVVALTGGYRRTPFLQIGADIYCDTRADRAACSRRWRPSRRCSRPSAPTRAAARAVGRLHAVLERRSRTRCSRPAWRTSSRARRPRSLKAFGADRAAMTAGLRRQTLADATAALEQLPRPARRAARRRPAVPARRRAVHRRLLGRAHRLVHPPRRRRVARMLDSRPRAERLVRPHAGDRPRPLRRR